MKILYRVQASGDCIILFYSISGHLEVYYHTYVTFQRKEEGEADLKLLSIFKVCLILSPPRVNC